MRFVMAHREEIKDRFALVRGYRDHDLHVILDNSSTHTTPTVQTWLPGHPGVHSHFTLKGASWFNMVEAWFSILTRKSVRRGSYLHLAILIATVGGARLWAKW